MSGTPSRCKRLLQDRETLVELVVSDGQRREKADHVAVQTAREEHETTLERGSDDRGGAIRRPLLELEREHRAEPADVSDVVVARGDLVETRAKRVSELARLREEVVVRDRVEHDG